MCNNQSHVSCTTRRKWSRDDELARTMTEGVMFEIVWMVGSKAGARYRSEYNARTQHVTSITVITFILSFPIRFIFSFLQESDIQSQRRPITSCLVRALIPASPTTSSSASHAEGPGLGGDEVLQPVVLPTVVLEGGVMRRECL
jgi:hypothetical protein